MCSLLLFYTMPMNKEKQHLYYLKHREKLIARASAQSRKRREDRKYRERVNESRKQRRQKRKAEGKCERCNEDAIPHSTQCLKHYLVCAAANSIRQSTTKDAIALFEVFRRQQASCAYTGVPLILGLNASQDHIIPLAEDFKRSVDVSNIQWTTRAINRMKGDMSHAEFVATCRKVVAFADRDKNTSPPDNFFPYAHVEAEKWVKRTKRSAVESVRVSEASAIRSGSVPGRVKQRRDKHSLLWRRNREKLLRLAEAERSAESGASGASGASVDH